jgi:tetratricopeptide (TPR) repeat protein
MARPAGDDVGSQLARLRRAAGIRSQENLARRMSTTKRKYTRSAVAGVEANNSLPGEDFLDALDRVISGSRATLEPLVARRRASGTRAGGKAYPPLTDVLIAEVEDLLESGDYPVVVRYAQTFSRFLFLQGELEIRARLGEAAESAASRLEDHQAQAAALIDDIGWSLVVLQRWAEAERHIKHGLDVADAAGLLYWQAKACRHLSGLALERGDLAMADHWVERARSVADDIPAQDDRSEMTAGIEYASALVYYAKKDYEAAQSALGKSEGLRREAGDYSRTVKVRAMFGKIFEGQGKFNLAYDQYRRGLDEARAVGRKDEQIRNMLGLARVMMQNSQVAESKALELEAREMSSTTPIPYEQLANTDSLA